MNSFRCLLLFYEKCIMLRLGCGGMCTVSYCLCSFSRCTITTVIHSLSLTVAFPCDDPPRMILQLKLIISYYAHLQLDQTYGLSVAVVHTLLCSGKSIVYYCPSINRLIGGCVYSSFITEALFSSKRRFICWCWWCPVCEECHIFSKLIIIKLRHR